MSRSWADIRKDLSRDEGFDAAYEHARLTYEISVEVRKAREARGLSQLQLAERLGTQQSVIARLEGGGITPTLLTLKRIADALGTKLMVRFEEPTAPRQAGSAKGRRSVKRTVGRVAAKSTRSRN